MRPRHLSLTLLLCCSAYVSARQPAPTSQAAPPAPDRTSDVSQQWAHAVSQVNQALAVVHTMSGDPVIAEALRLANGVFIVPVYRRAAVGVGGGGGGGVMLLRRPDGQWSAPVFYTLGALDVGLQAGAQRGPVALVLMNDKATAEFTNKHNFSLGADAGLTLLSWHRLARSSVGSGDVIAWTSARGLFGDLLAVGVSDIHYNSALTNAYYRRTLAASDVTSGQVENVQALALQQALAAAGSPAR
ncbi:lipid-binding SYLF domain-containing protein [Pseudoduganella aquatica]|uniref:Ysc84 actin-binding domain-containing protein n=1 Tax=Pseudoduganella aquatica TaxID=2660641 RepID=A0A7X4KMX2_9BURK|nr:lipid-binding SYLF domain-containing protein [Pseudoduganella aquatica]MYN08607.1 hypothetical protein [Pseudoduganella aquatica]